jgi:hypothetical protein
MNMKPEIVQQVFDNYKFHVLCEATHEEGPKI